jgi:cytochrome c oxidase assembly protein subunit 15
MAVPDWPSTFGHNMFIYPWSKMTASTMVFLEHSHRLVASGVGLITLAVATLVWLVQPSALPRRLALAASLLVILQGVLGGQRVIQASWVLGLVHGCLAQLFLLTAGTLALVLSDFWRNPGKGDDHALSRSRMIWFFTGVVFLQTVLGAWMRHGGPGFLSVPDFPKIYGEWFPHFWDSVTLSHINEFRAEKLQWPATTPILILGQVLHRSLGILAAVGILGGAVWSVRSSSTPSWWKRGVGIWVLLALTQVLLGVSVIWSGRLPELATLHVLAGAGLTLTGWLLGLASYRTVRQDSLNLAQSSFMRRIQPLGVA